VWQALSDVAEQWLDESVPGWREDIDRQAIQSGSDDEIATVIICDGENDKDDLYINF